MTIIRNTLKQPLVLNVGKGKVIHLMPGAAASLSEEEENSPQLKNLMTTGAIRTLEQKKAAAEEPAKTEASSKRSSGKAEKEKIAES